MHFRRIVIPYDFKSIRCEKKNYHCFGHLIHIMHNLKKSNVKCVLMDGTLLVCEWLFAQSSEYS